MMGRMNEKATHLTDLLLATLASYGMNVLGAIITLIAGFVLSGRAFRQRFCRASAARS